MFQISRITPVYYLTSVAHDRVPVFRSDIVKQLVCNAFNRARISGVILIFAYVIMPDHTHVITDSNRKIKEVLRFLNGNAAKSILDHLKEGGFDQSLAKLRIQERGFKHKYSVYQHHPNAFEIYGEDTMVQKVNYIHMNPVRAGLVEHPNDYLYSSARQWNEEELADEPLITDHKMIKWR